jgi:hypothetical protein
LESGDPFIELEALDVEFADGPYITGTTTGWARMFRIRTVTTCVSPAAHVPLPTVKFV